VYLQLKTRAKAVVAKAVVKKKTIFTLKTIFKNLKSSNFRFLSFLKKTLKIQILDSLSQ